MPTVYSNHSGYFTRAFENLEDIADDVAHYLRGVEYDTMIGTGLSGTLVVPTLARILGKHWAIVRKERSVHTSIMVEGTIGERWLFVDDFVSSGTTRRTVQAAVRDLGIPTVFVGTCEYERTVSFTVAPPEEAQLPRLPRSCDCVACL